MHKEIWRDFASDWNPLKALEADVGCSCVVVGLGASGLSALLELQKLGISAIGIDQGDVGNGAAGANGGFLLAGTDEEYHDNVARLGRAKASQIYKETVDEL